MGWPAAEAGIALLAGNVAQRQVAGAVLATLLENDQEGRWRRQAALALVAAAEVETDTNACWSLARACSMAYDSVVAPTLLLLAHHPDSAVRRVVAEGLPSAIDRDAPDQSLIVKALLSLMTDDDEDTRDWATFGLGQQLTADSAEIRVALVARLDDPHVDTRHEGLIGLARRRDPRGLLATLAFLEAPDVWRLAIEAAGYYASPMLLPALIDLRDDEDDEALEAAIAACDPEHQAEQLGHIEDLLERLEASFSELDPPRTPGLSCDLFSLDVTLMVTGCDRIWDLDGLLQRAGSVEDAARLVVEDTRDLSV